MASCLIGAQYCRYRRQSTNPVTHSFHIAAGHLRSLVYTIDTVLKPYNYL